MINPETDSTASGFILGPRSASTTSTPPQKSN